MAVMMMEKARTGLTLLFMIIPCRGGFIIDDLNGFSVIYGSCLFYLLNGFGFLVFFRMFDRERPRMPEPRIREKCLG